LADRRIGPETLPGKWLAVTVQKKDGLSVARPAQTASFFDSPCE